MSGFERAKEVYAETGVDAEAAIQEALKTSISIHCWQADDVAGFEVHEGAKDSGGIMATGNYPGRARNVDEVRADYEQVLRLVPGTHRANLHASYADTAGKAVSRDRLGLEHFASWIDWANDLGIKLDFNPTYFGHPLAASGFTLSHADAAVREFWIRHGVASRHIAGGIAAAQGSECVNNHWVPDGAKDSPADRWSPRARLLESFDEVLREPVDGCTDAVESKLFGLGSEDYVVGSFEFYSSYALSRKKLFCLDMGHFHPTESVADKLSALLQFHDRLLLHTSRPMRWDSDHVVIFNDDLKAVFLELARGNALHRAVVALDFFDASINRIAAYVIGIRATRKAILYGLLDPQTQLKQYESEGKLAQKLGLMEEAKTLPFGEIWDELCRRADVPVGRAWIADVEKYEEGTLSRRV
ncbi:L-rhamnose isomerase [Fimbriimonas ginsengisoli]|nr:L-rhamnose isomerase [Fimbriimonas ginsengisoli]